MDRSERVRPRFRRFGGAGAVLVRGGRPRFPPVLHKHLLNLAELERTANHIVHVAPMVIPEPLQTRDYAGQIMPGLAGEERELRVELRMARSSDVLVSGKLGAIICEGVLHDDIGGPLVLTEQLKHLIAATRNQQARTRILHSRMQRWTLAHNGSFVLFAFPKASPSVHLENRRAVLFFHESADVDAYRTAVDKVKQVAMTPADSTALLANVIAELGTTT